MSNYKSPHKQIIGANVIHHVPKSANIVHLNEPIAAAAAADSLFDTADNLVYSVPVNKTLKVLVIKVTLASNAGGTVSITTGDTENAETAVIVVLRQAIAAADFVQEYAVDFEWAATKFVTAKASTTHINHIEMIGYEY